MITLSESAAAALRMMYACLPLTPVIGVVVGVSFQTDQAAWVSTGRRIYAMAVVVRHNNTEETLQVECRLHHTQYGWTQGLCGFRADISGPGLWFAYDMSQPRSRPQLTRPPA